MNLHAIVTGAVSAVSPPTTGFIRRCTGSVKSPSSKRAPEYAAAFGPVNMQVQPLSTKQIEHVDSLNLQGIFKAIWINGQVSGADRQAGTGGDLVDFNNAEWLVIEVAEGWENSGWSHAIVSKQSS